MEKIERRRFLGLSVGIAAGIAGARTASGFQLQDMPVPTERAYRAACEAPAQHAQLLAEIDAKLAGRTLSAEDIQAIRGAARCPLCGCALVPPSAPLASDSAF